MALDISKLKKGGRIEIGKGLAKVKVAATWGFREGQRADLDLSAIFLGSDGKMWADDSLVFYRTEVKPEDPVRHSGDEREGGGEGECIQVDLPRVDPKTQSILMVITSYSEDEPIHFGRIKDAMVSVLDERTGVEQCRFDLTEDMSGYTSVEVGALRRKGSVWEFVALGECVGKSLNGLADILAKYDRG
jgi:tellurium resistance protein TerD